MSGNETQPSRIGTAGRWLAYVAFLVSFAILFSTALAHVAPWPTVAAYADIAAPLAGHAVVMGALAAVAVLSRRGALVTLAAAVAVTALGHAGLGLRHLVAVPFAGLVPVTSSSGLRFVALNGWHFNRDPSRLEVAINISGADVVVISEAGPERLSMLGRLAARYPHSESCADRWECSLVILSRLPIEASGSGRDGLNGPPLVWARVDASAHNIGSFTVVGTHLHRPSRNPLVHRRHVDTIANLVASVPGPIVLAGDFNSSPYSASYRYLLERTGLRPVARLLPTWPAWPAVLPQVALDHIFISQSLSVAAAGTGPVSGSDHLPIWAALMPTPDRTMVPVVRAAR